MTDLDVKLAALAAITGRDPIRVTPRHDRTNYSIDCVSVACSSDMCPFLFNKETGKSGSCTAPRNNDPALEKATIKTHELALTTYPELFL
jgi:hypothetical protein